MNNLQSQPQEIIEVIVQFASSEVKEMVLYGLVCKKFNRAISNLFPHLFALHFGLDIKTVQSFKLQQLQKLFHAHSTGRYFAGRTDQDTKLSNISPDRRTIRLTASATYSLIVVEPSLYPFGLAADCLPSFYFAFRFNSVADCGFGVGLLWDKCSTQHLGSSANSLQLNNYGYVWSNGHSYFANAHSFIKDKGSKRLLFDTGDEMGMLVDLDKSQVHYFKNGEFLGVIVPFAKALSDNTKSLHACVSYYYHNDSITLLQTVTPPTYTKPTTVNFPTVPML